MSEPRPHLMDLRARLYGLVQLDTSVPLYRGRGITVTAEGQRALTQHRAHIGVGTPPATAPHATAASKRTRR
ncbi:hypothetical protein ABCR94_33085 [Streptomyces sp. 21So2-11]|uniref:hypothetical protein n=1 Tax=Streptomyces sp. 21So2-11 TaxID=3144408 RepID=UPI00321BB6EF